MFTQLCIALIMKECYFIGENLEISVVGADTVTKVEWISSKHEIGKNLIVSTNNCTYDTDVDWAVYPLSRLDVNCSNNVFQMILFELEMTDMEYDWGVTLYFDNNYILKIPSKKVVYCTA
jgi:hypothetical protein